MEFPNDLSNQLPPDDVAAIDELGKTYQAFRAELGKAIVGQDLVIEQLAICLFARGHALLMGVPGLAKTLLVSSVAQTFDLTFNRIQFTPDLMPADITGTDIIQESGVGGRREFQFIKGPVFANIVLADEINRSPAKTQSAMLEAMQENKVTVLGNTYTLQPPFFVLATQNPIEQEGTYPLPEAQLDRFLFNIVVDYPTEAEEREIIRRVTSPGDATITPLMNAEEIIHLQQVVKRVPVGDHVIDFAAKLARATRPKDVSAPDFVKEMVGWGAGPRAGISLISAAKAHAVLRGRFHATTSDVAAVATPVLRHRVLTTFNAEAAGVTSDDVIQRLIKVLAPREELVV
jgi:MoxR-like ATPase